MPPSPGDRGLRLIPIDPQASIRLRASLDLLRARGGEVVHRFYAKLFEQFPGVRGMFPADMASQEREFIETLVAIVELIGEPDRLRPRIEELGKRHATYGARPEHYPLVCNVLIETLRETSGEAWSPQLETEWSQALLLVSESMLIGAGQLTRGGPTGPAQENLAANPAGPALSSTPTRLD
jgi:hemoglobin-like flavoprotein